MSLMQVFLKAIVLTTLPHIDAICFFYIKVRLVGNNNGSNWQFDDFLEYVADVYRKWTTIVLGKYLHGAHRTLILHDL